MGERAQVYQGIVAALIAVLHDPHSDLGCEVEAECRAALVAYLEWCRRAGEA